MLASWFHSVITFRKSPILETKQLESKLIFAKTVYKTLLVACVTQIQTSLMAIYALCTHSFMIYGTTQSATCNVMQSLYRTGQTVRVPGSLGSQVSRQSAHESVTVVSLTHRPFPPPPPPPGNIPGIYLC
jgi:hypothetical protein